jgi:DNA helicase-2/ATP-dependent DNA helicase PcrA
MKVVELLSRHPGVRDAYRARFSHLLVDEYQDTNYAQYRLLGLLAGEGTGLFVVGDDDQSIYGWRGADIRNILEFEEDFPESGSILLDVNYRSTGTILEAASRMIAHNEGRKPKVLRAEREEGEKIRLYRGRDDRGEARWVAGEIRKACVEEGFKYTDFAVLYRINAQSRVFEEVMREEGIPYRVIGTLGFYRRREIKDLIAFLKVIVNRSDSYSLLRIINVPPRGIGTRSIERLKGLAARHGTSLYEAMALSETDELLKGKRGEMLRSFRALLDDLVGLAGREGPGLMIREVLERTGYRGYLEEEDTKEALGRLENIDEFVRGADEFTLSWRRGGREASLADFLERTALMEETDASTGGPGGISLLTLHNAKGLEFPCVYIVGLEEGLLPWGGDGRPADGEDIEEERRLFYVGMTRAKTRLGLSYAFQRVNRGRMVHGRPSRFLGELPGELMSTDAPGVLYAASRHAGFEGGMGDESVDAAGSIHLDHFSNPSFRPGDRVYHDEFGSGVVLEVVGLGESLKLTVDFDCCGRKKLYPFYANVIREDG